MVQGRIRDVEYQDRSGVGFVTWNRYQDRSRAGFVMWTRYQGRCRGQGRGGGRARDVTGPGTLDVAGARDAAVAGFGTWQGTLQPPERAKPGTETLL